MFRRHSINIYRKLKSLLALGPVRINTGPAAIRLFAAFILLFTCSIAHAVLQAENTAVVINVDSADSRAVANAFIDLRNIPPANVVYLSLGRYDQPRVIPVEQFRDTILRPVFMTLEGRGLTGHIDCITWSCGIPVEIDISADLAIAAKKRKPDKSITKIASITGLTYLYQLTLAGDARYTYPQINFYACRGNASKYQGDKLDYAQSKKLIQARKFAESGQIKDARKLCNEILRSNPRSVDTRLLLALLLSRDGLAHRAASVLQPLVDDGWDDYETLLNEKELIELTREHEIPQLLMAMRSQSVSGGAQRATGIFSNRLGWTSSGIIRPSEQGLRYMLSTVLSVDGPRGLEAYQAIEYLQKSASADFTKPDGTVFFMLNRDLRSTTRSWAFKSAVRQLKQYGVKGRIYKGKLPPAAEPVAGLMAGSPVLRIDSTTLKIQPGAICEHLTSHGGVLQDWASQTPFRDFLIAGAAGSGGTVTEPFALGSKFPTAFMHCHYAAGCSLAESFFQSITGPYQYLVAGDPLCKPWANKLGIAVDGLEQEAVIGPGIVNFTAMAGGLSSDIGGFLLHIDGFLDKSTDQEGKFELDTDSLDEGYHELCITAVSSDAIHSKSQRRYSFSIDRGSGKLEITTENTGPINHADDIVIKAPLNGLEYIEFYHNSRSLGKIDSDTESLSIPAWLVGAGTIKILPIARLKNATVNSPPRRLRGRPLILKILPADGQQPEEEPEKPSSDALWVCNF